MLSSWPGATGEGAAQGAPARAVRRRHLNPAGRPAPAPAGRGRLGQAARFLGLVRVGQFPEGRVPLGGCAKASVLHHAAASRVVLLTTALPAKGTSGAEALRHVSGPGRPVHAVVDILAPDAAARLAAMTAQAPAR